MLVAAHPVTHLLLVQVAHAAGFLEIQYKYRTNTAEYINPSLVSLLGRLQILLPRSPVSFV
jgi:hypothetical protein